MQPLPSGAVCLAESQRAGRGRRGRDWLSPCARNLYLSMLWRFPHGPETLGGLALAVGLAVRAALEDAGVPGVTLKWPNDALYRGSKLAGALIELSGEAGGASCVVVGVGINVSMPRERAAAIAQPWTDASRAAGKTISRNRPPPRRSTGCAPRSRVSANTVWRRSCRNGAATMPCTGSW